MRRSKLNDFFLTFLVLLIGSKGNIIAISDSLLLFTFYFSFIIFTRRSRRFPNKFKLFSIFYLIITFFYFLNFGWINITSSIRVYLKILIGVMVLLSLRGRFFLYFEKLVVNLALISIPLYCFQIFNYDLLKSFVGLLENSISFLDYRSDWYVNNFIFTLNDNAPYRNSGFAWEPKGFSNILVLAIIINLLRNNFKFTKSLFILYIAVISTFSTVGYIIIFIFLPLFIYQQKNKLSTLKYALILIFVFPILSLDFMTNKVINEALNRENNLKYVYANTNQETVSLGRFGSMQLAILDFPDNPIIGIGMQDKERTQGLYTRLVWVNGLADLLSRFGLVGVVFLVFSYLKSLDLLLMSFGVSRGKYILFAIFTSIFFASAVIIQPLFFIFQFYFLIKNNG